ncbi:MAG: MarR family transcriptional regulator [Paludibacteraceae bacterium]|nr:MarR family transcriptional regulator [Paludibacteraceae bacterium]
MKENFTNIDNQWMGRELGLTNPYEREVFAHIYAMTTRGRGGWSGSVRELAERLVYPKSTVAKAVSVLISKGLLVKENKIYHTVPNKDTKKEQVQESVQQVDNAVPIVDECVQSVDSSVPHVDSLPPITPITNKEKDCCLSQALSQRTKEETGDHHHFLEFWEKYGVSPDRQGEQAYCMAEWDKKAPYIQRLIMEDITNFSGRDYPSPLTYLRRFKPRSPFRMMADEVPEYLSEGRDLAVIAIPGNSERPPRYWTTTVEEAELFGLQVDHYLRAAEHNKTVS